MLTASPLRLVLVLFLCSCVAGPALGQERPFSRRAVIELDSLRKQIDTEGLTGYAPSQFKEALELYREAKAAVRENEDDDELRERLSEARQAFREALQTARIAKAALSEVDVARKQMRRVPHFEENEDELRDAGREYRDALEEAEKGDIEDARDHAAEMMEAYRAATRIALREKDLEEARAALDEAEGRITERQYDYADDRLDRIEDEIRDAEDRPFSISSFYERYRRRIRDEIIFIYPDFYRNPPDTLLVGDFTLVVDSFHTRNWDFDREQITGADGTAWVSFSCERVLTQVPIDFMPRTFEVVEEVVNPRRQISEETAREVEQEAAMGEEIRLAVPPDSLGQVLRPEDIPRAALQPRIPPHLLGGSNPGDIKLSFSNLRIEPTGYLVTLRDGGLQIDNSAITGGGFSEGTVRLPRSVVRTGAGGTAELAFNKMTVQADLDLFGVLPNAVSLGWARPGTERRFSPYYSLKGGGDRFFYLSGTPRIDFRAARQAAFGDPGLADLPEAQAADSAEAHGVQGLILSTS